MNRHKAIPYDTVLGQMVTVRDETGARRLTAAEGFLLLLTRKGLQGDDAAARASLAAIETARAGRAPANQREPITIIFKGRGVGQVVETLGLAAVTDPQDAERVRYWLKPWMVEAALARLGSRQLTAEEQREVWGATLTPDKVRWPDWWTQRPAVNGRTRRT
jgi:hypothetical protein